MSNNITTKKVASYVLLPGLGPRVNTLLGSGFGWIAYLIAQIYGLVRLLPSAHPYLQAENIGRFGIRHVISEAANYLRFDTKHIDQIIIFTAVLVGIVLFVAQIFLLIYALIFANADAQAQAFSIFVTKDPTNDMALTLLDRVFGIKDFFCTGDKCTTINAELPWPMHSALHALFGFYSYGLMVIGLLIFFYFVVVIVAETAISGTPFGQRFQNVWVPVRLVMAISLLVPINNSLNAAQYVTLYAAKMGSGMASNAWDAFNDGIAGNAYMAANPNRVNPTGEYESLIGPPTKPFLGGIVEAMSYIHACAYDEWRQDNGDAEASDITDGSYLKDDFRIKPYYVKNPMPWHTEDPSDHKVMGLGIDEYKNALKFYQYGSIKIVFGEKKASGTGTALIDPKCGEILIPVNRGIDLTKSADDEGGAHYILRAYVQMIQKLWYSGNNDVYASLDPAEMNPMYQLAVRSIETSINSRNNSRELACAVEAQGIPACVDGEDVPALKNVWQDSLLVSWDTQIGDALSNAREIYLDNTLDLQVDQDLLDLNWGGAAGYYHLISQFNGDMQVAALNAPELKKYPAIMEDVRNINRAANANVTSANQFNLQVSGNNDEVLSQLSGSQATAQAMQKVYEFWNSDAKGGENADMQTSFNIFEQAMRLVIGADGIFDIRGENVHIHPLAQLSIIGKGMVENTIRNMAVSTSTAFLGGFMESSNTAGSGIVTAISGFFFSTAFIGLTAGIVLFYVMPFLPFLYFFFAVATWVKSIFEAMVGAPLWALAHLRIDGEGLPGEAAANGYFLIFEILIRPLLIVVGLIAAIVMFSSQVRILNFIWDIVVQNSGGYTADSCLSGIGASASSAAPPSSFMCDVGELTGFKRSVVDQFFFTVIYVIVVYMLGTASFKLIDMIPNNILRWTGSGATAFADQNEDTIQGISRTVSTAGMIQGQTLAQGTQGLASGLGGAAGKVFADQPNTDQARAAQNLQNQVGSGAAPGGR